MLTGEIRKQVDAIWDKFWTGGVTNPITVIEQFSYLLFIKRLDEMQLIIDRRELLGEKVEKHIFNENQTKLRWSRFKDLDPQKMFKLVGEEVFPFIKTLHGDTSPLAKHMEGASFDIPKAELLISVVHMIGKIKMDDRDTKGDLYEYMLSKLATSGVNGQFRTPRHIIRMMVEMMAPTLEDSICDPASGTCGFLMASAEYIQREFSSELSKPTNRKHFDETMFHAYDFDSHMLRIGAMNLASHGIEKATVEYRDSLSESENPIKDEYSIILANPPFKGSIDFDLISADLLTALGKDPKKKNNGKKQTEKSELLFLALIIRMLKAGGKAAVIVPDGVLFGSTKAHQAIRQKIILEQKLEAVISMPSGVFKPYAGVSTAILIFTKTNSGGTDKVWFYDMKQDGFSLDDKRSALLNDAEKDLLYRNIDLPKVAKFLPTPSHYQAVMPYKGMSIANHHQALAEPTKSNQRFALHEKDNIADILHRWQHLSDEKLRNPTQQSFFVDVNDIAENGFDLSIGKYQIIQHQEAQFDCPKEIVARIKDLQKAMADGLAELEAVL